MEESSSAPLKVSMTGPQTEVVVDDPSLVTSSPTATLVIQAVVSPSSSVTPLPSSTGLPLLAPIRVSASDSLLPSARRDPLATSFNLARETLCFMYQYDFLKGVFTEDPGAILRAAVLDTSRVSIYHASLFVFAWLFSNFDFFL